MPIVYIPALLQGLTRGQAALEVGGATVREVVDNLEKACPGIRARLLDQDRLRPNVCVAVDGRMSPLGLRERVSPSSEVHFIAAISGGVNGRQYDKGPPQAADEGGAGRLSTGTGANGIGVHRTPRIH